MNSHGPQQDVRASAQGKTKRKEGKVVKLSQFLAAFLRRKGARGESFDSILRRQFGLPSRTGEAQPLALFYVIPGPPAQVSSDLAEARGKAIVAATRKGLKKAQSVIIVREVP